MNDKAVNPINLKKSDCNLIKDYKPPSLIKYLDEVLDEELIIKKPYTEDVWKVSYNGKLQKIDFTSFPNDIGKLMKIHLINFLMENKTSQVQFYHSALINLYKYLRKNSLSMSDIHIRDIRNIYYGWQSSEFSKHSYHYPIRNFFSFLAYSEFSSLTKAHVQEIGAYHVAHIARDARIRSGDFKLTFAEEFKITQYLNDRERYWAQKGIVRPSLELLTDSVLVLCFSLGLRPKQLSMLKISDFNESGSDTKYYDLAISVIKQRGKFAETVRKALPSKWQSIIISLWKAKCSLHEKDDFSKTPLLSLSDKIMLPSKFSDITKNITLELLNSPKIVYQFRHTFAQRLADSGASSIEIATALTHTTTETSQVYVDSSPDMARIISEALGKSKIYKDIPDLFEGRLKVKEDVMSANPENQVSGLVNGVLMPGLGLCDVGLSLCDRSPILSCHTCPKFMPVLEEAPHAELAKQLRKIVTRFKEIELDQNQPSPPLAKLGTTLAVIEELIQKIREVTQSG